MKRGKPMIDADLVLARLMDGGPESVITRGEAAAVVAARVRRPDEAMKTARNRIGMLLDRSRSRSTDLGQNGLAVLPDGRYLADSIAYWARREFPGVFSDLPYKSRVHIATGSGTIRLAASGSLVSYPCTSKACHAVIDALRSENADLLKDRELAVVEHRRALVRRFKGGKENT